jgi:hypothetical protein
VAEAISKGKIKTPQWQARWLKSQLNLRGPSALDALSIGTGQCSQSATQECLFEAVQPRQAASAASSQKIKTGRSLEAVPFVKGIWANQISPG